MNWGISGSMDVGGGPYYHKICEQSDCVVVEGSNSVFFILMDISWLIRRGIISHASSIFERR